MITALLATAWMASDSMATEPIQNHDPVWQARHARNLALSSTSRADVMLLGDSITQNWEAVPGTLRSSTGNANVVNFGMPGDRTEHLLWRLQSGEGNGLAPKAILLMIGTNNAGAGNQNEADVYAGTRAVIDELKSRFPHSRILIQSILPRGLNASDSIRQEIDAANTLVAGLRDGERVFFQNLNRPFLGDRGRLRTNLFLDGIHPNASGYTVWARSIKRNLALMRAGRRPVDVVR